jgi:hypothetical protein
MKSLFLFLSIFNPSNAQTLPNVLNAWVHAGTFFDKLKIQTDDSSKKTNTNSNYDENLLPKIKQISLRFGKHCIQPLAKKVYRWKENSVLSDKPFHPSFFFLLQKASTPWIQKELFYYDQKNYIGTRLHPDNKFAFGSNYLENWVTNNGNDKTKIRQVRIFLQVEEDNSQPSFALGLRNAFSLNLAWLFTFGLNQIVVRRLNSFKVRKNSKEGWEILASGKNASILYWGNWVEKNGPIFVKGFQIMKTNRESEIGASGRFYEMFQPSHLPFILPSRLVRFYPKQGKSVKVTQIMKVSKIRKNHLRDFKEPWKQFKMVNLLLPLKGVTVVREGMEERDMVGKTVNPDDPHKMELTKEKRIKEKKDKVSYFIFITLVLLLIFIKAFLLSKKAKN